MLSTHTVIEEQKRAVGTEGLPFATLPGLFRHITGAYDRPNALNRRISAESLVHEVRDSGMRYLRGAGQAGPAQLRA